MTTEKYTAILVELDNMEKFYECECELAGKADIAIPDYHEFVKDGLQRISDRQEVSIDIVSEIYNKSMIEKMNRL